MRRLMNITLGISNAMAQGPNIFHTNRNLDQSIELLELLSASLVESYEEKFLVVIYHSMVGRYGHVPVRQNYAVEMKASTSSLVFPSTGKFGVHHDLSRNPILHPYQTIIEDEPEPSSKENALDDNNNDNNDHKNDNIESDKNTVEKVLKPCKKWWNAC